MTQVLWLILSTVFLEDGDANNKGFWNHRNSFSSQSNSETEVVSSTYFTDNEILIFWISDSVLECNDGILI